MDDQLVASGTLSILVAVRQQSLEKSYTGSITYCWITEVKQW